MNQIYVYIYIYIKFISILKLRSAKFIIIIAKREITDGLARVNATGSHNLSLFSKVGPSSFRNLKKKRKQEQIGRHPTGSRSSFPTKMASKYEEIHTEGNSVNDLTGFKAGKTLGKLTRKRRGGVASRLCPPRRRCRRWQASGAKHPRREFSYLLVGS